MHNITFIAFCALSSSAALAQLYVPPTLYNIAEPVTDKVTYTDSVGLKREVPIAIRGPIGKPGPLPVMIWSHGGEEGKSDSATSLNEWSQVTARAGYLTISPACQRRTPPQQAALCTGLGVTQRECATFASLAWDRPNDIIGILIGLVSINSSGPFRGRIDLSRVAVGGHSAGSSGALSVAGLSRIYTQLPQKFADSRPLAFIALSPTGPGFSGHFETSFQQGNTSWDDIDRPVLVGTGDGDAHNDKPPSTRSISFKRMPPGGKYLMYIHDAEAFHGAFAMDIQDCKAKGIANAKCGAFADWLASAAVAFLDAHVGQSQIARAWLQNGLIRAASGGVVEWQIK